MANVNEGGRRESEDRGLMFGLGCLGAVGSLLLVAGVTLIVNREAVSVHKESYGAPVAHERPVEAPPLFEETVPREIVTPPPSPEGPRRTPTRPDMVSAMSSVSDAVRECGDGHHGVAAVRVVFGSDGQVTSADVTGDSHSPPVRSCIVRAVRGARVPPFTQASFSVNYPFRL